MWLHVWELKWPPSQLRSGCSFMMNTSMIALSAHPNSWTSMLILSIGTKWLGLPGRNRGWRGMWQFFHKKKGENPQGQDCGALVAQHINIPGFWTPTPPRKTSPSGVQHSHPGPGIRMGSEGDQEDSVHQAAVPWPKSRWGLVPASTYVVQPLAVFSHGQSV